MASVGTVKFYNRAKGFGFIKPDDGDKDLFVHATALKQSGAPADDLGNPVVDEGDRVHFEVDPNPNGKGPRAINVKFAN